MTPDLAALALGLDSAAWSEQASALRKLAQEAASRPTLDLSDVLESRLNRLEQSEKWEVRRAVAQLLEYYRGPQTIQILVRLSGDANARVSSAAWESRRFWARTDRKERERERLEEDVTDRFARLRSEDPEVARDLDELAFQHAALVVGGIGHDLAKAVTELGTIARQVKRALPEAEAAPIVERLQKQGTLLGALARDSMSFVAKSTSPATPTPLLQTAQNALRQCEDALTGIEVTLKISPALNAFVPQPELERVLGNLLRNAAEACLEPPRRVTLRAFESSDDVLGKPTIALEVEDTGTGMESPEQCLVPFASTKKRKGTQAHSGLGLAIVKRLTERSCSGKIEIESTLGEGTTVRLLLPKKE